MAFAVLALAAVFALVTPMDVAVAQTNYAIPDGEEEHKDGEYKDGKSCPNKERKAQSQEQSS
ncbi:MAG: hypothetical protein GKS07_07945 [Nitrosopumilus sp.]|nr:MAG: hypothetical protein GKS07_07945 [Nitrosopumilus sp.]